MKNDGKKYEGLTATVFSLLSKDEKLTSVERDQKLDGPDGPRQIDVLVRSRVAGIDILTIVECRDHNTRPLDIGNVDALHSKMQDVRAQKAVLVSPLGFTAMAAKKAKRLGFSLATLGLANGEASQLAEVGLDIPVLVTEITEINVKFELSTQDIQGSPEAMNSPAKVPGGIVNGVDILQAVRDAFLSGELPPSHENDQFSWLPSNIVPPYYWGREDDDPVLPLSQRGVSISFKPKFRFGYVSQFSNSLIYRNLSEVAEALFFRIEDVATELDKMATYEKYEDVPLPKSTVPITAVAVPEVAHTSLKVIGVK